MKSICILADPKYKVTTKSLSDTLKVMGVGNVHTPNYESIEDALQHLQRIVESDVVYVFNPDGKLNDIMISQMGYARAYGKPIIITKIIEQHSDLMKIYANSMVSSIEELLEELK